MSDSDRGKRSALVAIALGFSVATLIFVSYAWMFFDMGGSRAQYAADRERNAQHNAAYTAQRIENECVGAEVASLPDCISEAVEAGAEYQQSERDLEAQRGMAKWAFWLLIISSGQLAATVVGLIYLKGTLDATWGAVKGTQRIVDLEQSPFLVVRPVNGKDVRWENGGFENGKIRFTIENVGRGPAIVTAIYRSWSIRDPGIDPEPIAPGDQRSGWKRKPVEIIIGPSSHSDAIDSLSWRLLIRDYLDKVQENSQFPFYGYIEFQDLAGRRYVSGFMYLVRQDAKGMGLHLALPEQRADQYNYHRSLDDTKN